MMDERDMQAFADELWAYFEPRVRALLANYVSAYRAQVVSAAANGVMGVQRPFDDTVTYLPYASNVAGLSIGDQCTVFVLGSSSNAIVMGDGMLSGI